MADKGGFGPDMRHVRFQADVEREPGASRSGCSHEDGGVLFTIQDADRIVAVFRTRWMRILMAQIVVVATVTGWLLFTGYEPSLPATPFQFMMGHLMTVGAGISIGFCGLGAFDHHRLGRDEGVVAALFGQYAPVAVALGWGVSLLLFWRFLHGWTPAFGKFFVSNGYGLFITAWAISLASMRWVIPYTIIVVARWRMRRLQEGDDRGQSALSPFARVEEIRNTQRLD